MEKEKQVRINLRRALARQEFINKWTNVLIMSEYKRLRHEKVISNDTIHMVEQKLSEMNDNNYHETMNFLNTVLSSINKIYLNK